MFEGYYKAVQSDCGRFAKYQGKDGREWIDSDEDAAVTELNGLRLIAERLAIYTSQLHIVMDYLVQRLNKIEGFTALSNLGKFRQDFVDPVLVDNKWDKMNMEDSLRVAKELMNKKEEPKVNIIGLNGEQE